MAYNTVLSEKKTAKGVEQEMEQQVDLHMHSAASDGTDSPAQLLAQVQAAGIRTFALTDHDTIEGCAQVEALVPPGLRFIRGVEFSCITSAGKCHILGYGYQPEAPSIHQALEAGRVLRQAKLTRRLNYLEEAHGIRFSEQELQWLSGLSSPGKPHLAQLIMDRGLAASREEAISRYIDGCKGGDARIDGAIAVRGILEAGGIPVWAHPLGGEGERHLTRERFHAQLTVLMGLGIQGLECCYSRYTRQEVVFLLDQAERHGLLVSGGSDYHGTAKNIPLGTLNVLGDRVPEETLTILTRLNH